MMNKDSLGRSEDTFYTKRWCDGKLVTHLSLTEFTFTGELVLMTSFVLVN